MAALSASSSVSVDTAFSTMSEELLEEWTRSYAAIDLPPPCAPPVLHDPITDAVNTHYEAVKHACTLPWNFGRNELLKVFGPRVTQVSKGEGTKGTMYFAPFPLPSSDEQPILAPRYFADYKDKDTDQKRAPKELQAMLTLRDDEAKANLVAFLKKGPKTKDVYFPAWLLRCFMPHAARQAITTPEQVQALFGAPASAKKSPAAPKATAPPAVPKAAKPASAPKPASPVAKPPIVSEDEDDEEDEDEDEISLDSSSSDDDDDDSDDSVLVSDDDDESSSSSSSEDAVSSKRRRSDTDDDSDEPVHKRQRGDCHDFDRLQADHGEKTAIKSLKEVFKWNAARVRSLEAAIAKLEASQAAKVEDAVKTATVQLKALHAAETEAAVKAAVEEATSRFELRREEEETARKQKAAQFFAQMQGMF
jgi:hypothetical protein